MAGLDFLGYGVLRPFQRDLKNDFANGGGLALLTARIGQVLGTKAATTQAPGELPWRGEFGSRLHILRHRNNNPALVDLARQIVLEALGRWERNVVVTEVTTVEEGNPRRRMLRVRYRLVDQQGATVAEDTATTTI